MGRWKYPLLLTRPSLTAKKAKNASRPRRQDGDHVAVAAAAGRDIGAQRKAAQRLQVFLGPLRPLEIQARRQGAHALARAWPDLALAPLEQIHGVGGLPAVRRPVDLAGAGGGTALDVMEKAGNALVEDRGAAGAQAEEPGDGVDQAPGLAGIDQRAEGEAAACGAPGVENPGGIVSQRDLDEREALVVLQPDVERRQVAVHQVALQQQGVGLGLGDDGLQGTGMLQQALQQRVVLSLEILGDAFLEVGRLADVERLAGGGLEDVDPGPLGKAAAIFQHREPHRFATAGRASFPWPPGG